VVSQKSQRRRLPESAATSLSLGYIGPVSEDFEPDSAVVASLRLRPLLRLLARRIVRVDRQPMHRGAGLLDQLEQLVIGRESFVVHPVFELPHGVCPRRRFGEEQVEPGEGQVAGVHGQIVGGTAAIGQCPFCDPFTPRPERLARVPE
jgi:hypothetical protein